MQRFEIVVHRSGPGGPSERRLALGRVGGWLGAALSLVVVAGVVAVALVIGYLLAGLLIAAFLALVLLALLRSAFGRRRRSSWSPGQPVR